MPRSTPSLRALRATAGLITIALTAPAARSQATWEVDKGGSGDFTTIQAAVNAAAPGDRIEVIGAGPYDGFLVTEGLDVEALDGAVLEPRVVSTIGEGGVPVVTEGPCIEVRNVPTGEELWISGFSTSGKPQTGRGLVEVENCTGGVLLHAVVTPSGPHRGPALIIEDCSAVLALGCQLEGGLGTPVRPHAYDGATITNSNVAFQECAITGGVGWPDADAPRDGGHGLTVVDSELFAYDTRIEGGRGGKSLGQFTTSGNGGDGVRYLGLSETLLPVLVGACELAGGAEGAGAFVGVPGIAWFECPPGASSCPTGTSLHASDDCTFDGGACGGPGAPPGLTCLIYLTELTANGSSYAEVPLGTSVTITAQSLPTASFDFFASGGLDNVDLTVLPSYVFLIPQLLLDPLFQVASMPADAQGQASYSLTIATDPAFSDRFLFFQVLESTAGPAVYTFSNVVALRIR